MDYRDDEDLRKGAINQMMGELDDVTAGSLKKPSGPVKGVEIAITVSPKSDEEMAGDADGDGDDDEEECVVPGCEDPMHEHAPAEEDSGDYISGLLKKLG